MDLYESNKPLVEKVLKKCKLLLPLVIIIPLIVIFVPYLKPQSEDINIWFQRCGSIIVLLVIYIEINLYKIESVMNPSGIVFKDESKLIDEFKITFRIIKLLTTISAIIGTLIWGYGDLILKSFG